MKSVITLSDAEGGQVAIKEIQHPGTDETDQSVTVVTALVDEMLSVLDGLGDTEE